MDVVKVNKEISVLLLSRISPFTFASLNLVFKAPRENKIQKCRISFLIYLYFKEVSKKAS